MFQVAADFLNGFAQSVVDQPLLYVYLLLFLLPPVFLLLSGKKARFVFMWRSKLASKLIASVSHHFGGAFDRMAEAGVILGTGVFGVDYVLRKRKSKNYHFKFVILTLALALLNYHVVGGAASNLDSFSQWLSTILMTWFGVSMFLVVSLVHAAVDIFANTLAVQTSCPSISPVLPGVSLPGSPFFIPLAEGWIALIIAMIVHEFSHGVLIRHYGLKLESAGILTLGLFPAGAFVEPDEKEFKKVDAFKRFKVLAAGSVSNLVLAGVVVSLMVLFVNPAFNSASQDILKSTTFKEVKVSSVAATDGLCGDGVESPASKLGVKPGWVLYSLNGKPVETAYDLQSGIGPVHKNETILVQFKDENGVLLEPAEVTLSKYGFMGVTLDTEFAEEPKLPEGFEALLFTRNVFLWTWLLNFLVGLLNFLPLGPIDGGKLQPELMSGYVKKYFKGSEKKAEAFLRRGLIYFLLGLVALNALPWILNPLIKAFTGS